MDCPSSCDDNTNNNNISSGRRDDQPRCPDRCPRSCPESEEPRKNPCEQEEENKCLTAIEKRKVCNVRANLAEQLNCNDGGRGVRLGRESEEYRACSCPDPVDRIVEEGLAAQCGEVSSSFESGACGGGGGGYEPDYYDDHADMRNWQEHRGNRETSRRTRRHNARPDCTRPPPFTNMRLQMTREQEFTLHEELCAELAMVERHREVLKQCIERQQQDMDRPPPPEQQQQQLRSRISAQKQGVQELRQQLEARRQREQQDVADGAGRCCKTPAANPQRRRVSYQPPSPCDSSVSSADNSNCGQQQQQPRPCAPATPVSCPRRRVPYQPPSPCDSSASSANDSNCGQQQQQPRPCAPATPVSCPRRRVPYQPPSPCDSSASSANNSNYGQQQQQQQQQQQPNPCTPANTSCPRRRVPYQPPSPCDNSASSANDSNCGQQQQQPSPCAPASTSCSRRPAPLQPPSSSCDSSTCSNGSSSIANCSRIPSRRSSCDRGPCGTSTPRVARRATSRSDAPLNISRISQRSTTEDRSEQRVTPGASNVTPHCEKNACGCGENKRQQNGQG
uniref:Uncharacterized protein n=1 Tax=Sipha flava TaxID=143950 RepID=A0A2S2QV17_9HEMI